MTHPLTIARRRLLAGIGAAALLPAARAADALADNPIKVLGVFSLLSDTIDVTLANRPITDTRITGGDRSQIDVRDIGFDTIVLRELRAVLPQVAPQARTGMFRATKPLTATEQREIAAGARRGELPAWIAQAIEQQRMSHVLLVTRARDDVKLPSDDGHSLGRGQVDGIGFYVDPAFQYRNTATGVVSNGVLGAYTLVDLQLMDVKSAEIVRSQRIGEQLLVADTENRAEVDPWAYLTPGQKVDLLRKMLERNLRRLLPLLLKPA